MILKIKNGNAWLMFSGFEKIRWQRIDSWIVREGNLCPAERTEESTEPPTTDGSYTSCCDSSDYVYYIIARTTGNDEKTFILVEGYILNDEGKTLEILR